MNKSICQALAVSMLASSLVVGCANDFTVGDAMQGEGAALAEIGANWEEGNDLVAEGQADIEKGRKMIAKGRERVAEGKEKVSEGKAQREKAERTYRERTGRPLPEF